MTQASAAWTAIETEARPGEPDVREQIEATEAAVLAADEAPVREANAGTSWERVGVFRRLRRSG
jgi:hypothetical protein